MREKLLNMVLLRGRRLRTLRESFAAKMRSRKAEGTLRDLLEILALTCRLDTAYGATHAPGFPAAMTFRPAGGGKALSLLNGETAPEVVDEAASDPAAVVNYRDERELVEYLLGLRRQGAETVLSRDVACDGNPNCLRKLAYMVRRLNVAPAPEN